MNDAAAIAANTATGNGGGNGLDDANRTVAAGNQITTNTAADGGSVAGGTASACAGPTGSVTGNTRYPGFGREIVC